MRAFASVRAHGGGGEVGRTQCVVGAHGGGREVGRTLSVVGPTVEVGRWAGHRAWHSDSSWKDVSPSAGV